MRLFEFTTISSTDDVAEEAVLSAVQDLISQGHTDVDPSVITNMVVAATSQPFLLKDLIVLNNNSEAIQHYIDSINPSKVKFSSEILTVKNENPEKKKEKSLSTVSNMAKRAIGRSRLGEDASSTDSSANLLTALNFWRNRYKDSDTPAKIKTQSLINMVLSTDKTFDYASLADANENNPAVKNLIKSFNREYVELQPYGDEVNDDTPETNTDEDMGIEQGQEQYQEPVDTVDDMAKRAAKQRGAAVA